MFTLLHISCYAHGQKLRHGDKVPCSVTPTEILAELTNNSLARPCQDSLKRLGSKRSLAGKVYCPWIRLDISSTLSSLGQSATETSHKLVMDYLQAQVFRYDAADLQLRMVLAGRVRLQYLHE